MYFAVIALSEVLGSTTAEATCQPRSRPSPVVLQLFPLLQGVFSGDRGHGAGHDTISDEAQRSIHRPISKCEISPRCPKVRDVAVTQERCPVRKARSACSNVSTSSSTSLPARRETARGCDVRTGPRSKTAYQSKGVKGQYVADLFAGKGGVAKACRQLGYRTKEWELSRG